MKFRVLYSWQLINIPVREALILNWPMTNVNFFHAQLSLCRLFAVEAEAPPWRCYRSCPTTPRYQCFKFESEDMPFVDAYTR